MRLLGKAKTEDRDYFRNHTKESKIFIFYVTCFGLVSDYNHSISQNMYTKLFTILSKLSLFVPPLFVAKIAWFS